MSNVQFDDIKHMRTVFVCCEDIPIFSVALRNNYSLLAHLIPFQCYSAKITATQTNCKFSFRNFHMKINKSLDFVRMVLIFLPKLALQLISKQLIYQNLFRTVYHKKWNHFQRNLLTNTIDYLTHVVAASYMHVIMIHACFHCVWHQRKDQSYRQNRSNMVR